MCRVCRSCLLCHCAHVRAAVHLCACCSKEIYWKASGSSQNGKGQEAGIPWRQAARALPAQVTPGLSSSRSSSTTRMHLTCEHFLLFGPSQASEHWNQGYVAVFLGGLCVVNQERVKDMLTPWFPLWEVAIEAVTATCPLAKIDVKHNMWHFSGGVCLLSLCKASRFPQ